MMYCSASGGKLIGYGTTSPQGSLKLLRKLVLEHGMQLGAALALFTVNAADAVGLRKGRARVGDDADLLILDATTLELQYVISKGRVMKTPEWTARGLFEQCYCTPAPTNSSADAAVAAEL